jgi:hypothetical protein
MNVCREIVPATIGLGHWLRVLGEMNELGEAQEQSKPDELADYHSTAE